LDTQEIDKTKLMAVGGKGAFAYCHGEAYDVNLAGISAEVREEIATDLQWACGLFNS